MKTRILTLLATLMVPAALRAVDIEMKIDVAGAERTVVIRLDEKIAPKTSANFAKLCGEGFYDGIGFHRVIANYIVQTGDPLSKDPAARAKWGTGGPGYTIPAELGGSHVRGAIAAARLGDQANPEKASSGSQFYVALRDIKPLDGKYTVFGNVISGLETFDEIAGAPADEGNVPTAPIAIISTRVLGAKSTEPEPKKPAVPDLTATEATKPAAPMEKPATPAPSAVAATEPVKKEAAPMEKPAAPAPSAVAATEPVKKEAAPMEKPATPAPSAVAATEPAKKEAAPMEKPATPAPSAVAATEPVKKEAAPMEKPAAPAPTAVAAVEPVKKEAAPVAKPVAEPEPAPKPVAMAEPAPKAPSEKPALSPLAWNGETAAPKPATAAKSGSAPVPVEIPPLPKAPVLSPLSLNDSPSPAAKPAMDQPKTPAAAPQAPVSGITTNAAPVADAPAPNVADALAAAMRGTPAPEPGAAPPAAGDSGPLGFTFGDPIRREPAAPAPAPAPGDDERMPLNSERGLPAMRLTADEDTLANATSALSRPGGAGATDPDDGFMPLSSVGNLPSTPAPAKSAAPAPQRRLPDPPRADAEPDPLAFPTFRQGPTTETPAAQPRFATAPETTGAAAETDPLAPPAAPVDPAAAPAPGEETPAAAPRKAEPEKPRGFFGKFIRRVW
jgi:cyclophilin family peptidyl-prolyl cis-trans isomerase